MRSFPTTIWGIVLEAGEGDESALTALVERYRPAVVGWLRGRGADAGEAEDLAQEVFLALFERRVLARVDRARGRFRDLLLAVTRHVLAHHLERGRALKRGGDRQRVPLEEALPRLLAEQEADPVFDRALLTALVEEGLRRLAAEHPDQHACLRLFLLEQRSHKETAAALGKTEGAVRNHISRGKARLLEILRGLVAEQAASAKDMEEEVRWLTEQLRRQEKGRRP